MSLESTLADLQAKIGTESHVGPWMTITQDLIDQFAKITQDFQWIHTDIERAKQDSPFGKTVAHGYFTLALLSHLTDSVNPEKPRYPGVMMGLNYGLNRVRFPHPIVVDSKIRARTVLQSVEEIKGTLQVVNQVTVEIEGVQKPACVAETVSRLYF